MTASTIRLATEADAEELMEVCKKSFFDTFTGTCTELDMQTYLAKTFPLQRIIDEINDQACWLYVLVNATKIGGYVKIGRNLIAEMKSRKALEIERLYLLHECIGKGNGDALMQKCFEIAKNENTEVIYLGVWEHNYRAQKFYSKYGFELFGQHPFPIESTPQTDLWLKKELQH